MPIGDGGTPRSPWDWFHINAVSEHAGICWWTRATPGPPMTSTPAAARSSGASAASSRAFRWGRREPRLAARRPRRARRHDLVLRQRRHAEGALAVAGDRALAEHADDDRHADVELRPPDAAAGRKPGRLPAAVDGNWFVGWGQEPFFTEFSPDGQILFDAHLPIPTSPTRSCKFPWAGNQRSRRPCPALQRTWPTAYVSWNGASNVASYRCSKAPRRAP